MVKKILPFLCSLAPLYAFGATKVDVSANMDSINLASGYFAVFNSGTGVNVTPGGVDVENITFMFLNPGDDDPAPSTTNGDLYIVNPAGFVDATTGIRSFGITSAGAVNVRNKITIGDDLGLYLNGPVAMNVVGAITANGVFNVAGATSFTSGAINSGNELSITAGQISTGAIDSADGNTSVIATSGNLSIGGIKANSTANSPAPTTMISGTKVTTGNVQNLSGTMSITSTGDEIVATGSVQNFGTSLALHAGTWGGTVWDISIDDGWLTNSGTLDVVGKSLSVGGVESATGSSFVNSGVATFKITGLTEFVNGMNLSGMGNGDELNITTGTLSLGTDTVIANNASTVNIKVTNGTLGASNIGISNGDTNTNNAHNSATMSLAGHGVSASTVYNNGSSLTIGTCTVSGVCTPTSADDIAITGGITALAGTTTVVNAGDELTVGGAITNAGNMTLYGQSVELAGVANSGNGSVLNISAPTNNGSLLITGAITNADGTTTITSKGMDLHGSITNNSGTLNIVGSDTSSAAVSTGSIVVHGGAMNLNAWTGGVSAGNLDVDGGVLNLGNSVHSFVSSGNISVAGNVNAAAAQNSGNGDVYLTEYGAPVTFKSSAGSLTIDGNVLATSNDYSRTAIFDVANGAEILIKGATGVSAQNKGHIVFGSSAASVLTVKNGGVSATNGGTIEIYSGTVTAQSLTESGNAEIIMHSGSFEAKGDDISIANGIWFDGSSASVGMVIDDALDAFELKSTANDADMTIGGGVSVGSGNALTLNSAHDIAISGNTLVNGVLNVVAANAATFNNSVSVNGSATPALNVSAKTITLGSGMTNNAETVLNATATGGTITSNAAITNAGTFTATAADDIDLGDFVSTTGTATITSNGGAVTIGALSVSDGTVTVGGDAVTLTSLTLVDGTGAYAVLNSPDITVNNAVNVYDGDLVQGDDTGALSLLNAEDVTMGALTIESGYGFVAKSGTTDYTINGAADFGDYITVNLGATSSFAATSIESGDVTNNGTLSLSTTAANLSVGAITNNGVLDIDATGDFYATNFTNGPNATATLSGVNMILDGALDNQHGMLYQDTGTLNSGDMKIVDTDYEITASSVTVQGIEQSSASSMIINTSDLTVNGNIDANDLTIAAQKDTSGQTVWSNIAVDGNVSGGVKIFGLEHMTIGETAGGNYTFDDNSLLHAAILPYATSGATNTTTYNYWATVALTDDNSLGTIRNSDDNPENALVYVNGRFNSNLNNLGNALEGSPLVSPQIGINLYDIVDQGSAIWLLYAKDGINDLATKIRNLNVNFCNADGSRCFNYFDAFDNYTPASDRITNGDNNGTEDELPIYLSVRDYDNDGEKDSLYIVFDPRFGGPVKVFDIEPIVERVDDSTDGELIGANGLDNMVAGGLANAGFYNDTPIEAIPLAFADTNLEELATELYNRMEQYVVDRNGTPLARFSRLVQPREIEQVAGSVALNEHTSFRDFEDHMFDEFIWNRNRNLRKAWVDVDFGLFRHDVSDDKTVSGNRFNITAGYDWQNSARTVVGLMGHVSHMSSKNSDSMDLSYMPGETIDGYNHVTVADTNIGIGAYLMHALGFKARVYGNAMLDLHMFDLSREQNYVSSIDGTGTALSLITEWGLMHDWLNQYIVGNLYARLGYNFGFSVKEEADSDEYMRLKSDGYLIFTPGYSLIAQKRIYTSSWFQVRPYASIGIEYDVLGMPDVARYKFGPATKYAKYDIDINPLWANIGAGIEMLSANGIQVGFDYRYQYNNDIQMHNLRLSGSFRF